MQSELALLSHQEASFLKSFFLKLLMCRYKGEETPTIRELLRQGQSNDQLPH